VHAGSKQPWQVVPKTKWILPIKDSSEAFHISGAAYDVSKNRIYVGQSFSENTNAVIHVFELGASVRPVPPANVQVAP
jgi:hypothetical protein